MHVLFFRVSVFDGSYNFKRPTATRGLGSCVAEETVREIMDSEVDKADVFCIISD